jgi:tRNA-binding protein
MHTKNCSGGYLRVLNFKSSFKKMTGSNNPDIDFSAFQRLDIRVGRILEAAFSEKARVPAYKLTIDFGTLGIRKSSARITALYSVESLTGQWIVALVNVPPRKVAGFISECLVLGALGLDGEVILLQPDPSAAPGDTVL